MEMIGFEVRHYSTPVEYHTCRGGDLHPPHALNLKLCASQHGGFHKNHEGSPLIFRIF